MVPKRIDLYLFFEIFNMSVHEVLLLSVCSILALHILALTVTKILPFGAYF